MRYSIAAALAFLVSVSAPAPAPAKTQIECSREFEAKATSGATGGQSRARYIKACLVAADPPPADSDAGGGGGGDINKLRQAAQNPVADLISVQFQDNPAFNYGPYNGAQNVLNFQPVIPLHLNDDWNLIARPITPIVYQPRLAPGVGPEFGLGNIEPELFISPAHPGALIWGVGPAFYLPTATDSTLGVNAWGAGPAVVGLTIQGPWVVGALVNNIWAWRNGLQVNQMTSQYFINYNLPDGWYLTSQPVITANWLAPGRDKWIVPFGGGVGRLFKIGNQPVNAQVQAFHNAVRPTVGPLTDPVWSLRFQLSLLFPTK